MVKKVKIINWICFSFGVVGIIGLYRYNPHSVGIGNFLLLLPYGTALIALREDTRKAGLWMALVLNLIYGSLFLVLIILGVLGKTGSPMLAIAIGFLYGAGPCGLNAWVFIQKIRRARDRQTLAS